MKPWSPEKLFVIIASIFGVLYLVLTPPFQSPDENRHFFRAYQISEGTLTPTKFNKRIGGFLPKKVHDCLLPYSELRGSDEIKTSQKEIWQSFSDHGIDKRVFVDFPSIAVYSPISYIPQALGIALIKPLKPTPIMSLYAARFMTLICWILALVLAIRTTPMFKWLFVALALLPMSIYIHSSVTADMMTNAFSFLFIAFVMKSAFSEKKVTPKQFLILVLLIAILSSSKLIYSPLVLLFLLIPIRNFSGRKQFFARFTLISIIAITTPIFWALLQGVGYVSYSEYNIDHREYVNLMSCANLKEQVSLISDQFAVVFDVIGNSLVNNFGDYSHGYIGTFGWGETTLSSFIIVPAYVFLSLVATTDGDSNYRMTGFQRIVLIIPFVSIFVLVILSQYLIWSCVGADETTNLQGRYFIPIVPLLLMALYNNKRRLARFLPVSVALFSIATLTISSFVIYNRFYVPISYIIESVTCDHETPLDDSNFKTSNHKYVAGNVFSRSSEKSFTGNYSSKVSASSPFGTLISFEDCNYGDLLLVEAWRLGSKGEIVISNDDGVKLYLTTEESSTASEHEWEKIKLEIKIPSTIVHERVSCYLFTPSDSCYFDDFKVVLKRRVD